MSLLFVHNQHVKNNYKFYNGLCKEVFKNQKINSSILYLTKNDILKFHSFKDTFIKAFSYEDYYLNLKNKISKTDLVDEFIKKYPTIYWCQIISSERSFSDYSMLLNSTGNRIENSEYIEKLVINITNFIALHIKNKKGVICQSADTLFSYIAIKLAKFYKIKVFIINPCFYFLDDNGGGFFAQDENLHNELMKEKYQKLKNYKFTKQEIKRAYIIKDKIVNFKNMTTFMEKMKGFNAGSNVITPEFKNIFNYLAKNSTYDKNIFYTKIDPIKKIKANIIRTIRKNIASIIKSYGDKNINKLPLNFIYYPMHFQPEQSTLAQGNWFLNQISLIENISKSLPLGFSLIVKEHPWGRGNRPNWQYKYISNFHNVQFCDASSIEIIKKSKAVLSISGTSLVEALVLDKPAIMFGKNYFEFSKLIHKVNNISDLPNTLYEILIKKNRLNKSIREKELNRFFVSYLTGIIHYFPIEENVIPWSESLLLEIKKK